MLGQFTLVREVSFNQELKYSVFIVFLPVPVGSQQVIRVFHLDQVSLRVHITQLDLLPVVVLERRLQVLEPPLQLVDEVLVGAGRVVDALHLLLKTGLDPVETVVVEVVLVLRVVDLEGRVVVVVVRIVRIITLVVHLILVHF